MVASHLKDRQKWYPRVGREGMRSPKKPDWSYTEQSKAVAPCCLLPKESSVGRLWEQA